jgi:hypothetical protein
MPFTDVRYYLEAVAGDGGSHTASVWWLSPDIILNGGTYQANPSGPNTVGVLPHNKPGDYIGPATLMIDVYVGDPSLVMTPTGNTTKLTNDPNDPGRPSVIVQYIPGIIETFTWINGGTPVEAPGHKCLIAQVYPSGDTPSTTTFDLPFDQHVAQHNIDILQCGPSCELVVNTINPNPRAPEVVTVRAIADTKPAKHVLQAARNMLKQVADFKRLRTKDVPRFKMEFEGFPDARLSNNTGEPSAKGNYGRLEVPN